MVVVVDFAQNERKRKKPWPELDFARSLFPYHCTFTIREKAVVYKYTRLTCSCYIAKAEFPRGVQGLEGKVNCL